MCPSFPFHSQKHRELTWSTLLAAPWQPPQVGDPAPGHESVHTPYPCNVVAVLLSIATHTSATRRCRRYSKMDDDPHAFMGRVGARAAGCFAARRISHLLLRASYGVPSPTLDARIGESLPKPRSTQHRAPLDNNCLPHARSDVARLPGDELDKGGRRFTYYSHPTCRHLYECLGP